MSFLVTKCESRSIHSGLINSVPQSRCTRSFPSLSRAQEYAESLVGDRYFKSNDTVYIVENGKSIDKSRTVSSYYLKNGQLQVVSQK